MSSLFYDDGDGDDGGDDDDDDGNYNDNDEIGYDDDDGCSSCLTCVIVIVRFHITLLRPFPLILLFL